MGTPWPAVRLPLPPVSPTRPAQSMEPSAQLVVFVLAQQRFAVWLRHVACVLAAVQTTPVPGAPPVVLGVIDLHGAIVPILDLRQRWPVPRPEVQVDDQFVIVQAGARLLGLLANETVGLVECPSAAPGLLGLQGSAAQRFEGAIALEDGLVLIHDIEQFMRASESQELELALVAASDRAMPAEGALPPSEGLQ